MPKKLFEKGNQVSKGHGRPPGSGFTSELKKVVGKDEFRTLVRAIYDQALAGDTAAAGILVNRLVPPLRPASEPVAIPLPADATPLDTALAVMAATAGGTLSPTDGKMLLDALAAVVKIQEIADLIPRIEALENRR